MEELKDKASLKKKLISYTQNPDDDNILFKQKIYDTFLNCPELLYAINEKNLESELFNDDGTINYEGEWNRYFSDSSRDGNIRPYLFIPQTQTEVHNYVCYQVHFEDIPRYDSTERYCLITFNILVHGEDRMDKLTGIPRHDLIASIIREKMAWNDITSSRMTPVQDKEGVTDNNYLTRTIVYRSIVPNALVNTNGKTTMFVNKGKRL